MRFDSKLFILRSKERSSCVLLIWLKNLLKCSVLFQGGLVLISNFLIEAMALTNYSAHSALMEDYDNGSFANGSMGNGTVSMPHYPSGYTTPQIVLASIVVTILMIVVVVGNMLVIIAITTEKALKNIQNWFIASLAVADFFLGLVIMPFSLANELMGYWIFGSWWCDVHSAMDVLLSTASIMNLCLISLDRYWSITQAVSLTCIEYLSTLPC